MHKVVAVIQARMGSTRLPGKVLMDLNGKTVLRWMIDAARASELVDEVVVATPDHSIMSYCEDITIHCTMGPEDNVIRRFEIAAQETGADMIVRLTSDCPFVDPWVIDQCVAKSCCATQFWPDGLDVQTLRSVWLPLGDKEHVIPVNNTLPQLPCPMGNLRHMRMTLDTFEDLENLRLIAKRLPKDRPPYWQETVGAYNESRC